MEAPRHFPFFSLSLLLSLSVCLSLCLSLSFSLSLCLSLSRPLQSKVSLALASTTNERQGRSSRTLRSDSDSALLRSALSVSMRPFKALPTKRCGKERPGGHTETDRERERENAPSSSVAPSLPGSSPGGVPSLCKANFIRSSAVFTSV